jgi:hypothetical protein
MRPPRPSEGDRAPHHAPTRILSPSKSLRTKCLWALKETGCPPIKIEIPRKSPKSLTNPFALADFSQSSAQLFSVSKFLFNGIPAVVTGGHQIYRAAHLIEFYLCHRIFDALSRLFLPCHLSVIFIFELRRWFFCVHSIELVKSHIVGNPQPCNTLKPKSQGETIRQNRGKFGECFLNIPWTGSVQLWNVKEAHEIADDRWEAPVFWHRVNFTVQLNS